MFFFFCFTYHQMDMSHLCKSSFNCLLFVNKIYLQNFFISFNFYKIIQILPLICLQYFLFNFFFYFLRLLHTFTSSELCKVLPHTVQANIFFFIKFIQFYSLFLFYIFLLLHYYGRLYTREFNIEIMCLYKATQF